MCYLREFRVFVAAYEERSFSAAAKRENATQSAISQRIRKLEEVLNVRLFNRHAQYVEPTPAASIYYQHCLEMLKRYEMANQDLQRFRGVEGEVTAGVPSWMSRLVMPAVLDRFLTQHPNVSVGVVEGDHQMLAEQVSGGQISFAVVPTSEARQSEQLLTETEGVLVSAGTGMGHKRIGANAAELSELRLVIPQRGSPYRQVVENYLASVHVKPRQVMEFDSVLGTLGLVAKGGWHTIMPAFVVAADPDQDRFDIRPVETPPQFRLSSIESARASSAASRSLKRMIEGEISRITLNATPFTTPLA